MIHIIDFGSQTTHLISRRVRDLGISNEIIDPEVAFEKIKESRPAGIIFSGGPSTVYHDSAPSIEKEIFDLGIPILSICYGCQLTAHVLGGKVKPVQSTFGPSELLIKDNSILFKGIPKKITVWESHSDSVSKLPLGFKSLASTSNVKNSVICCNKKLCFGLHFHPEVEHTQEGKKIFKNFLVDVCGLKTKLRKLDVNQLIQKIRDQFDKEDKDTKAIAAVSGGVDSTVAGAIVAKAIGKRFIPIYCDNGLMRVGTRGEVESIFSDFLKIKPIIIDCKKEFLSKLKDISDPEKKRKIIGNLYIKIFEREALKIKKAKFLVQGTIYSDVIESKGDKLRSKIKSHHNVGGLPAEMKLKLIEPLRNYYKDEVKEFGRQLGLPEDVVNKQPFPGPGQAIRILGSITKERLKKQQLADQIVIEVLKETGWFAKVFQSFPIMTDTMTTAVKGDERAYSELVGLRIYDSRDIMTAGWTRLPYEVLQKISSRIVNEVPNVSRVAYDITTKPPATMEWE